jgi:branched-chain amino acid transport system ATP-binding protein
MTSLLEATMSNKPVLEVERLEVRYGAIEAIKGISLHVNAGEIVTIIGGNGAGKSTLMKTISGLEPAAAGRVLFAGQDVTQMPGHLRVSLGIAQSPEGRQVFPDQTVLDNLLLGAFHRKDSQAVIDADVEEQVRIFPRLIERLAPLIVKEIFGVIRALKERGVTILLVEQMANQALAVADRAYVLETGRITLEGKGAELRRDPKVRAAYLGAH